MRRFFLVLCVSLSGGPGFAQSDALRDILIHGEDGDEATAIWLHQPGGGLDLGGAIALPCMLADLSFDPSGEIVFADIGEAVPDCPEAIASGARRLSWETVVIERLGVERLRISDTEEGSSCDFAVIETSPELILATTCDNQDYPRYFRFVPQPPVNGDARDAE
ncbi:MAG: hypothetical protein AAGA70_04505 [Pseudomonadota bacterium]